MELPLHKAAKRLPQFMNITPQNNPEEFEQFLFDKIGINLFHHKFLKDYVDEAIAGRRKLYDKSVISYTESGWIIILHGEMLLIYGENWNYSHLEEVSKVVDLKKFNDFAITGKSNLINDLMTFQKFENYSILKERILYQTDNVERLDIGKLKIENGNLTNLDELSTMLQQYYHEEYKGENDKSIFEMQNGMSQLINSEKIYVLKNQTGEILSFCTIIDPDIGILFTKSKYRKSGYAKVILSFCSNLLLKKNDEVFLMTDKNEMASNKTSISVGFKPYYNNSLVEINCG
jgi:hypothetical protein